MDDRRTTVIELRERFREFVRERDWEQYHSPKNLAMSVAIEAAELMEVFQWCTLEEAWKVRQSPELEHVREELADVIIYCLSLANQMDIDISSAVGEKLEKNATRYPPKDKW
jgi:NTP pyrophosphatase (non-canonical NTP hydrolase)